MLPANAKLIWEPVHLSARSPKNSEIAVLIVPRTRGDLVTLPPRKAGQHEEWDLPKNTSVLAVVLGPDGLNMSKVKSLVARNEDLLSQLADYAQQTSEVESLVQELANSEQSGGGADAALRGFSSRWGVMVPRLDPKAPTDQQASALLSALLPAATTYDPLGPSVIQMQQTGGLAAAVAGLFFGNTVGLAAGGTALVTNLKAMLFPNTEFRSAFAQVSEGNTLAFCAKNQPAKSRTRPAYLWAYRFPDFPPPITALNDPAYVATGSKSTVQVQTAEGSDSKQLGRARDWRLVPLAAGAAPVPVAVDATAGSLIVDLTKANAKPGDYRLTATWDWDALSLGVIHLRPYDDFRGVRIDLPSRDRLIQGSGVVTAELAGADFEFVRKVELEKVAAHRAKPVEVPFDIPRTKNGGEQASLSVDIDTATPGDYRLLISQSDGVRHPVPVTVLPPNPVISHLPVRVNLGEPQQSFVLEGTGLARIESLNSEAATISGSARHDEWDGQIHLNSGARIGERFPLSMKVRGLESPVTIPDALEVVGPRPAIVSAQKAMSQQSGTEMRDDELPTGANLGFVVSTVQPEGVAAGARPQIDLGCRAGQLRQPVKLSPGEAAQGATLNFAGSGSLYLSIDPGTVGYPGCDLTATVTMDPNGRSDPFSLGRVVRVPFVEKFTLTSESLGPSTYLGILEGRDLDVIEKTGWDSHNGVPVDGIPAPVPGGAAARQTLRIAVPWPSPTPHSRLFIWLRGESAGRRTSVTD